MTNRVSLPAFIAQKRGMIYFLVLYFLASVIFFFVYHPLGMFGEDGSLPEPIDVKLYMVVLLMANYMVLITSRVLLYNISKKHEDWTFGNAMLWVVVEFVVVDLLVTTLGMMLGENDMITFVRMLARVTVDLLGLYMVPMLSVALVSVTLENSKNYKEMSASYNELQVQANALTDELEAARAEQAARYRESQELRARLQAVQTAVKEEQAHAEVEKNGAGLDPLGMLHFMNRTGDFDFALPRENVLYIETVDNYINVNYLDGEHVGTRIIRNTMKVMEEHLQPEGFMRCHRQYLVNKMNIKSVSREKDGYIVHLKGCNKILPVGKTYVAQLLSRV